jgi:GAF domain-containing protein
MAALRGQPVDPMSPSRSGRWWMGLVINEHLVAAVREFTGSILNPYDLEELLHRLTHQAATVLDAVGTGIMLVDDAGHLGFVAASSERVLAAERLQDRAGDGACHEAHAKNEVVVAQDLTTDGRWPDYTPHVLRLGLRAVVGIPMNAFGQTIGVLNVYRDRPTVWAEDDVTAGEILVSMGAGYILNANQMRAQDRIAEQLEEAVASRDLIGQAKGILMARNGIDGDRAFELLRMLSQRENRKLRDVARQIVERHPRESD